MAIGAGTLIGGRFRLIEPVGQGGMGRVWRGHDQVLGRDVAVKEVLLPDHLSQAERGVLVTRTTREAQSTARLNHPSVVTIHDVIEHGGAPWIVMEYVPGPSLTVEIAASGGLPWQRVAAIGAKIADALAHAHAAGIVHRDLKPDNVLLAGERVVVTDFGIARMIDHASRLTLTGTVIGTLHYMAPEQLEGRPVDTPADIWSLGATLYTAIEGQPPFDGPTRTAIVAAILARDPAPPVHAGPLSGVLAGMLAKEPGQRPDAEVVARTLGMRYSVKVAVDKVPATTRSGDTETIVPQDSSTSLVPPRQAAPPVVSLPEPAAVPASQPPAQPSAQPPGRTGTAVAGLCASVLAAILGLVSVALIPPPSSAKSDTVQYAGYTIALLAALAALLLRKRWQPLASFSLGVWYMRIGWLFFDFLAIPAFHSFSGGGRFVLDNWISTVSDVMGLVAAILLTVALTKSAKRGRWPAPRALAVLLFCGVVLSEAAFRAAWFSAVLWPKDGTVTLGAVFSQGYPLVALWIVEVIVTAVIAWYALTMLGHWLTSAVLLGWLAFTIMDYLNYLTVGYQFRHRTVAANIAAAVLLAVVAVLILVRGSRRPAA
jgi:serine/threonine protein kinase